METARLMGGVEITEATKQHADEMLELGRAEERREQQLRCKPIRAGA